MMQADSATYSVQCDAAPARLAISPATSMLHMVIDELELVASSTPSAAPPHANSSGSCRKIPKNQEQSLTGAVDSSG